MTNQLDPRNGHIIVQLIRPEASAIFTPESSPPPDAKIVIVAVAPDVPSMPKSNEPQFRVGDCVLGLPGQNILGLPGEVKLGIIHYSAIVAIDRR